MGTWLFQGSGAGLQRSPRFAPSLGVFGRKRGNAVRLCIPESGCTSVYVFLCRCVNCQGFDRVRSEFEGHLQKIAEIRRGREEDTLPSSEGLGRL